MTGCDPFGRDFGFMLGHTRQDAGMDLIEREMSPFGAASALNEMPMAA